MKIINTFKWIKKSHTQLEWLNSYLKPRLDGFEIVLINEEKVNDDDVKKFIKQIERLIYGDALELFNMKTRTAWNQYKRRLKRKSTHVTSSLEIKKSIYKNVVNLAKQYNIPITLAVEELLEKGCELAQKALNKDRETKIIASLRKKAITNSNKRNIPLSLSTTKYKSKDQLIEAFSTEAYERHILELEFIEVSNYEDERALKSAQEEEIKRYTDFCESLNILNLLNT